MKQRTASAIIYAISGLLVGLAILILCSCAIRVAPVGDSYTKPDGKGGFVTSHNPSLRQPKDDPNGFDILGMFAGALPGPWGYVATGLLTMGAGVIGQRKKSEGTIKRISEGVHAFATSKPEHADGLFSELSKSMDKADKAVVKRVKPTKQATA